MVGLHNFIIATEGSKSLTDFELEKGDKEIKKRDQSNANDYDPARDIDHIDEFGENIPTNQYWFEKYGP